MAWRHSRIGRGGVDPSGRSSSLSREASPSFALHQSRRLQLEPLDILSHVVDFFAPALGVGVLSATLTKAVWRSELRSVTWVHLTSASTLAAALALVAGLLVLGQDGRMATYAAMVAAIALSLWWIGFRPFK